jgi:sulfonate transport system ATP-binding protein
MGISAQVRDAPGTSERSDIPLVRVDNATFGYWVGDRFHAAVSGVSFEIAPRETLVLIGPTGCGKTTLLKAVAGFIAPAAGSITIGGKRTLEPGPDRVLVFQEFDQLFPWRTVLDNVAYPLRVNGRSRRAARERAREFLSVTKLLPAVDRYPHQLSGGMKQRVAIARALALEPTLLLMDEPFGSLDAITRQRLQAELRRVVEQTHLTLLFVTHSIEEALLLGEHVVVLRGSPSTVVDVVEVQGPRDPQTPAHRRMRDHLRSLLALADATSSHDDDDSR